MATRKSSFDKTLDELRAAASDLDHVHLATFRRVLATRENGFLIAEAARRAEELVLRALVGDLENALDELLRRNAKSDPGCKAEQAIVQALSSMAAGESAVLERACRHVQMEPSGAPIGPKFIDTAGDLRSAALRALAVQMDPSTLNLAVELLTDASPVVRAETARLLAEASPPGAESVLRLIVLAGESDADVLTAAFFSLLRINPARSLPFVAWFVSADTRPGDANEEGPPEFLGALPTLENRAPWVFAAVLALGEARPTGARDLLVQKLSRSFAPELVHHVMLGLALLRDPKATELLFEELEHSPTHRAEGALVALAMFRHEEPLADRARSIVEQRGQRELSRRYQQEFRPSR